MYVTITIITTVWAPVVYAIISFICAM